MSLEVDINVLTFFVIKLQYNVYNYDVLVIATGASSTSPKDIKNLEKKVSKNNYEQKLLVDNQ